MPVKVTAKIPKPSRKTTAVSGTDMESLRSALDKLPAWGSYAAAPAFSASFDKATKKVAEIKVTLAPAMTVPKWAEYGKSTKDRQAEWDRMVKALEGYLTSLHNLTLEAVAEFAARMKDQDLDKAGLAAANKAAKEAMLKAVDGYAKKTANGRSAGVELADIPPDKAVFKKTVPAPKAVSYSVAGKTIEAVFNVLKKRAFWGRYRSNASFSASFQLDGHVKEFTLTSSPVITMPKWKDYSKGNKGQKGSWDNMWAKLNAHENNHHGIFVKCAASLEKKITSTDILKSDLNGFWDTETKDWQKQQDAYDKKTNHGVKEGVALDFSHDP